MQTAPEIKEKTAMRVRWIPFVAVWATMSLAACSGGGNSSPPVPDTTPPPEEALTARFDPSSGVVPFPTDLLLSGTRDLTLNIPVANPDDTGDPRVAMNALDGFGTIAPWSTTFSVPIAPGSVVAGDSVRMFEVTHSGPGGAVTGVVRELESPQEYVAVIAPSDASGRTLAIVPTQPLDQLTSYMVVLTKDLTNAAGREAFPSQVYHLARRTDVLCVDGISTDPSLPDETACALEPLRQLVNAQEIAAAAAGVDRTRIVLSWVATTQAVTPVLQAVNQRIALSPPAQTRLAPTGMTLGDLGAGLPPVADIYIGTIDLPYYLAAPSAGDPTAPLTGFWHAAPGAYQPPFDAFGLDPTSTHVTYANPLPIATSIETVPLLLTVPNVQSGQAQPAEGWPVVIFQHGITGNRTNMFAIAGTLAAQGFAVVAIDIPLHGVTDPASPFYVGNTPFAAFGAEERTFDLDFTDNATGAAGPDGVIDPSGSYFINLTSLLTSRDNVRQGVSDLSELAKAIPGLALAGVALDGSRVRFVGQSLGAILGTEFLAVNAQGVDIAALNVPGGGLARMLEGSPAFGPRIRAGLADAGLTPGTPDYDAFFTATQTVIDSADPLNFAFATAGKRILLQEVIGSETSPPDQVITNTVPGAPLSGTEPLIAALGLDSISGTVQDAGGIRGAVRFIAGAHGSLLDPGPAPAVTAEMQGEVASFLASQGTAVLVANPEVIAH
jgi:pimeloyl-ACP methyl ester carboxylesterase